MSYAAAWPGTVAPRPPPLSTEGGNTKRMGTTRAARALGDAPILYSVMQASSAEIVAGILRVLYPDAATALDATYGNGRFWNGTAAVQVTGLDSDPVRARDRVGDFRALPYRAGAFDVVLFDPPYHTDMGRGKASIMGSRFSTFDTIPELRAAVEQGCREAWRVASLGVIVKCQDYIHAARPVWMSEWIRGVLGEPYDAVIQTRRHKIVDPKWTRQLSVWRNHATFWVFRKDGAVHRPRSARRRMPQAS